MDNILSTEQSTISSQDSIKYGYIYLTENLINHKKYIGRHKSSRFDPEYKGSGKYLWRAINKYGWDNFIVKLLKWCYSEEELNQEEINFISQANAVASSEYYNIHVGGQGGDNKSGMNQEDYDQYRERVSKSKRDRPRTPVETQQLKELHESRIGTHMSDESKEKSRRSNLGQKRSEETKSNMSKNHADFNGNKNPFYGKHHSEETRKKLRENHKGSDGKRWITNKSDVEILVSVDELEKYFSQGFVRGRLRKSQKSVLE